MASLNRGAEAKTVDHDRQDLGSVFKTIRMHRNLSTHDLALKLGINIRLYQRWESGAAHLTLPQLKHFAEVTNCDLAGLLLSVVMHDPDLAIDVADSKLIMMTVMALADLHKDIGIDVLNIHQVDAFKVIGTLIDELKALAKNSGDGAARWYDDRVHAMDKRDA